MIVIHIESGLGNQMLSYCEYLALRKKNPSQEFFMEDIIYDIPECNEYICQWNGYELQRIFGIDSPPNIKTLFSEIEWNEIINEIRATEFWKHNWNYPVAITETLNRHGLHLENVRGDFDPEGNIVGTGYQQSKTIKDRIRETTIYSTLLRWYYKANEEKLLRKINHRDCIFKHYEHDVFTGQWLNLKFRNNGIDILEDDIRKVFKWPDYTDKQNREMAAYLSGLNSVAIHARRGDALGGLAWCYNNGYFQRAVKYIRHHVENPVFVFFTNTGSVEWCKENLKIFGLNSKKDTILFVDWNKGEESYRDMQLMCECKHAIITTSSFGWWGAYLNPNKDKITISPQLQIESTYHC